MFQTADPLSWEYDANSNTTKYTLRPDYSLCIRGNHQERPCGLLLKPEILKLLDILVCGLEDGSASRRVELPLEQFLRLAGYAVTEANKNDVRGRLQKSIEILKELRIDWAEKNGRYPHPDVKIFDKITYQNGGVCACFSEAMALYLRGCPSMLLPLPLLAINGKSPHCYPLGRRCLVHNAANKGQKSQVIRVRSLLAVCPRIPRTEPGEKWSPSILERKVIDPFTTAMDMLEKCGVFVWKFREPVCRSDYESFSDSIVEFQVQDANAPALPGGPDEELACGPFNYPDFLAIR